MPEQELQEATAIVARASAFCLSSKWNNAVTKGGTRTMCVWVCPGRKEGRKEGSHAQPCEYARGARCNSQFLWAQDEGERIPCRHRSEPGLNFAPSIMLVRASRRAASRRAASVPSRTGPSRAMLATTLVWDSWIAPGDSLSFVLLLAQWRSRHKSD